MTRNSQRRSRRRNHLLCDHVELKHDSSSLRTLSGQRSPRGRNDSASEDSEVSDYRLQSEEEDDEEDLDSVDEDLYTTRNRQDPNVHSLKAKSRRPPRSSRARADVSSPEEKPPEATPSTEVSDLSVYIRSKNSKAMKNRHVARKTQRHRKMLDHSIWHSEVDPSILPERKNSAPKSENKAEKHKEKTTSETPKNSKIETNRPRTSPSSLPSKKRPSSLNSNLGYLMKNIGVKGAHGATSSKKAPSTPRLIRSATSRSPRSGNSPGARSPDINTPSPSKSTDIPSSPFIEKFDSNVLRHQTPKAASTPAHSFFTPTSKTRESQGASNESTNPPFGAAVTHAIFQALFGEVGLGYVASVNDDPAVIEELPEANMNIPMPRWDDSDEEEEEDEHDLGPELAHCKDIDAVDEQWLGELIKSRSNSRSNSLDLTCSEKSAQSPLLSAQGSKSISTLTPMLSSEAFQYALRNANGANGKAHCNEELSVEKYNKQAKIQMSESSSMGALATTDSILQTYITPNLITQLVLQLPHDDDRLTSPRLSVLKALFKNCPSLRFVIKDALIVASHNRHLRCEESRKVAHQLGNEVNDASLSTCCENMSGFEGRAKNHGYTLSGRRSTEEGTGTFVRDHDSSLVELTLFILITECPPVKCDSCSSTESSCSQGTLDAVVTVISNVMRCYGSRLGKSSGSVEQPGILRCIFKMIDILVNSGGKEEVSAVIALLKKTIQRWPRGNHVQEVACLKLCRHILPSLIKHNSLDVDTMQSSVESNTTTTSNDIWSEAFNRSRRRDSASKTIQKTLRKLVHCMSSPHFKVASEAIQTIMQLNILHPYFISNPNTLSYNSFHGSSEDDTEVSAVECVVEALRQNREHWHPQVQHLSEEALDNLLDYL